MGPFKASSLIAIAATLLNLLLPIVGVHASEFAVFIVAGGTNALGRGTNVADLPPEYQSPQNDVLFWYEEGSAHAVQNPMLRIRSNGFVPLQFQVDTTGTTFGGPTSGFGAELSLGRLMSELTDSYPFEPDSVAIVKFAFDSTSFAVDWNPDSTGSLYHQMLEQIDLAVAELESRGHTTSVRGLLWIQGEIDATDSSFAAEHGINLNKLVCGIRWYSERDQMVTVTGLLPIGFASPELPFLSDIRSAQNGIADSTSCAFGINLDTIPITADSMHLSSLGQLVAGEVAVQYMELCALGYLDCFPCLMGDVHADYAVDVLDVVGTINVAFRGVAPPMCPTYPDAPRTDGDCDGVTDVVDVVRVVNIAFRGASWNPCDPCDCYPYYPINCPEPCKRFN